jgi:hypothetical protein
MSHRIYILDEEELGFHRKHNDSLEHPHKVFQPSFDAFSS